MKGLALYVDQIDTHVHMRIFYDGALLGKLFIPTEDFFLFLDDFGLSISGIRLSNSVKGYIEGTSNIIERLDLKLLAGYYTEVNSCTDEPENYKRLTEELECLAKQDSTLTKKSKRKTNPDIKTVIDYWHNKVLQEKGFKPVIDGADAVAVKRALNALGSVDRVKQAIDWFLENKKSKEIGIVLSVALSKHSLNLFLATESDDKVIIKNAINPQKQEVR